MSQVLPNLNLASLLRNGPMPPGAAVELGSQLAGLLEEVNPEEPLRLSSIELYRKGRADLVAGGSDPPFGAPEGSSLGPSAQRYALGAMLFQLLLGSRFKASADRTSHENRRAEARNHLRVLAMPDLEGLIHALLAFEPEQRPTLRDVRSVCLAARARFGGSGLKDWLEEALDPARRSTPAGLGADSPDGFTGTFPAGIIAKQLGLAGRDSKADPPTPEQVADRLVDSLRDDDRIDAVIADLTGEIPNPKARRRTRRARRDPRATLLVSLVVGIGLGLAVVGSAVFLWWLIG